MPIIPCNLCGKQFKKKLSQIKLTKNHYCSSNCYQSSKKNGKNILCYVCHKQVYKDRRTLLRSKFKKYFCSHKCANTFLGKENAKENHPNWRGGEASYRYILKREKRIEQCVSCKSRDTRVLIVHHIDKSRKNNSVSNLIWLCHNCHFLVHKYGKELITKPVW